MLSTVIFFWMEALNSFLIEFLAFVNGEGKAWELNVFKPLNHFKHACLYLNYDLYAYTILDDTCIR